MDHNTQHVLAVLLAQAGAAHGVYETNTLGGQYDQRWPEWYAHYLVRQGIGELFPRPISEAELALLLQQADVAHKRDPAQPWPTFYARQLMALVSEGVGA